MSGAPESVMLFAAGFGTRMGALTRDRPKPLIEVGGIALIDHALTLARQIDPARIVVNTHYRAAQIEAHLAGQDVQLSREQPGILDTGGGLRAAVALLGHGPVFTMNTDAIWSGPNPLHLLRAAWAPERMDALLMCIPTASALDHAGPGDFSMTGDGSLRRGPGMVYGGVQIIKTDGLDSITEQVFSLNLLWDAMGRRNRLFGLSYPGTWCDVGHPGGIATAENLLRTANV